MTLYLPIAEMSVSVIVYLALGMSIGFLSGLFGVGGGFLLTPLLTFLGVPSAVAVATSASHVVASSVSGAVTHYRRGNVDIKMGLVMLAGGLAGTYLGVSAVKILRRAGYFDFTVAILYVVFLGVVGTIILVEGINASRRQKKPDGAAPRKSGPHGWIEGLPFKMRFPRSKLYISAVPPVVIGMFIGVMSAIMGIGGGFVIIPAMIYLLRMPTGLVIGTSLFQIVFVAALATVLHAVENKTVDIVLASILIVGGVIGAQFGTLVGEKLRGEHLRVLLGVLILVVAARMAVDLVVPPEDVFSLAARGRGRLMRTASCAAIALMFAVAGAASADAPKEGVEADASTRQVAITSSFTGTEILVFGAVQNSVQPSPEAGTYDVIVIVEGMPAPVVVRKQSRVGGNLDQYAIDALRVGTELLRHRLDAPRDEIAEKAVLDANGIGFDHVHMARMGQKRADAQDAEDHRAFKGALIRLKEKEHVYVKADFGVSFIGTSLFRATIALPPNVPVGPLTAHVYLFKEGQMLGQYESRVMLQREGVERYIHDTALEQPLFYGIFTVLLAAASGLAAAFAFRKPA